MASLICPLYESHATFTRVYKDDRSAPGDGTSRRHIYAAAFQCNNSTCRKILGGEIYGSTGEDPVDYWPRRASGKDFPDVPASIASAADEAHRCLSIGAVRAAIGMARAVVEATAKDHKAADGTLQAKIKKMVEDGVIGQDTAQAADAVRLWGNDAAHGDLALEEFEEADGEEVIALMDEFLNRAYQSPARTARIKESRKRRKRGEVGGVEDTRQTPAMSVVDH